MLKVLRSALPLIVILAIAFFFRFYRIDFAPARLNHDEMSFTYNSYSILKTGKDEWNKSFPLIFTAFGDYKTPLNIYLDVPFVALWGMTPLSTKMVSILSGLAMVVIMYYLALVLTKQRNLALVAALLMAINPWPIQVSRVAINTHLALVFYTLGIILFLIARRKQSQLWAALAGIAWGVTFYDYVAYRLIIFIMAPILLAYTWFKRRGETKLLVTAGIGLVIVLIPLLSSLFNTAGLARFRTTSIFFDQGIILDIDERRSFCYLIDKETLPSICQFAYNKPVAYGLTFIKNWAEFLLPTFLFVEGDSLISHSMPGYGMFLIVFLPFYLIGLYLWFKKSTYEANLVKLAFLIAPIPSAFTGPPQTMRGTALMPFVVLFVATGIMATVNWFKRTSHKQFFVGGLTVIILFLLFRYSLDYFFVFQAHYDNAQYMIDRRIADYVKKEEDKFDKIVITNKFPDAYIVLAYYNKLDPQWLADNLVRYPADQFGFMHAKQLGKYYFENHDLKRDICDPEEPKVLIFTDPSEEFPATEIFYNFSKVHPQVKIYDVVRIREGLRERDGFNSYCNL